MKKVAVLLCLIILTSACRQSVPKTPEQEEKRAQKECTEEQSDHTAPPPAYGNKVVRK